jgi:hypothetical protein
VDQHDEIPQWLTAPALERPTVLHHWDGAALITLSRIDTGYRLLWIFHDDLDDEDGVVTVEQFGVFIHLTASEADAITESRHGGSLIEPIRSTLHDPEAVVWRTDSRYIGADYLLIPSRVPDERFGAHLWRAAEYITPTVDRTEPEVPSERAARLAHAAAVTRIATLTAAHTN